jgi:hypothetical protein
MKVRLSLALVVAVVSACLIPGPAAAAPPTEEEFSPVGDRFLCGETVVTVQSGTVLEREHSPVHGRAACPNREWGYAKEGGNIRPPRLG